MAPQEIDWRYVEGRDREGDKFANWTAVHGSGRILAVVRCPFDAEYWFSVKFICAVPERVLNTAEGFDFIDAESAKSAVEAVFQQFDPIGATVKAAAPARERETA